MKVLKKTVIRISLNEELALRLGGAVLMENREEWITGNGCPKLDKYHEYKEAMGTEEEHECSKLKVA